MATIARPAEVIESGTRHRRRVEVMTGARELCQNLRCGHYEFATETSARLRLAAAFIELVTAI
jgi:hypothetical protein